MSAPEPDDLLCPSCGRQFGDRKRCLYCAARLEGRQDVGRIQLYALPLVFASFFYFYLAMSATPSYRALETLGEDDNFGRVRVRGEVLSVRLFTDKYKRGTSIVLGLGELDEDLKPVTTSKRENIRLKAEGRIGQELESGGRVPVVGDIVDVSASLFSGENYRVLSLNSARNLKVIGATENKVVYTATTVAKILADPESMHNKGVELARVRIVKRLGRFHLGVMGEGSSRKLRVYGLKPWFYRPDDVVSLRGRLTRFKKGRPWELKVDSRDPKACVVLEKSGKPPFPSDRKKSEAAEVVTVAELLANPDDYWTSRVAVGRAKVVTVQGRRSMDVSDETGSKAVKVFGIDPWQFEPGDIVSVSGTLTRYEKKNRWELKVGRKGPGVQVLQKVNPDRKLATIAQLMAAPGDYENENILVLEAVVTTIKDAKSFQVGDFPGIVAAPVSGITTASVPVSISTTNSVSVSGSSTRYLREGAKVKIRGEFVKHADGDEWGIKVAGRDYAAVHVFASEPPAGEKGR